MVHAICYGHKLIITSTHHGHNHIHNKVSWALPHTHQIVMDMLCNASMHHERGMRQIKHHWHDITNSKALWAWSDNKTHHNGHDLTTTNHRCHVVANPRKHYGHDQI